jgi:hypothetical protein
MCDILDMFVSLFELFDFLMLCRLLICLILSAGVIGLIYWLFPESGWRIVLSILVGLAGLETGIIWEVRNP